MFEQISKAEFMRALDGLGVHYEWLHVGDKTREECERLVSDYCERVGDDVLCCDGMMRRYKNYGMKRVCDNGERSSYLDLAGKDHTCYRYVNASGRAFYISDCGFSMSVYCASTVRV